MSHDVVPSGIDASRGTQDALMWCARVRGARYHSLDLKWKVWQGLLHGARGQNATKGYATDFPYAGDQGLSPLMPGRTLWTNKQTNGTGLTHRCRLWSSRNDLHLAWSVEDTTARLAREVLHALHAPVVLPVCLRELYAYPLPRRKRGCATESHHSPTYGNLYHRPERRVTGCRRH